MVVSILVLQVDSDIRCRVYLIRSLIEAYQIAFLQSGVAVTLDQNGLLGVSININSVGGVGGVAILNSAVFLRYDTVNSVCGRTGRLGGQFNISCNNLVVVQNRSNSCTRLSLDIVQVADGVCVEITRLTISSGLIYEYNSIRSSNLIVEGLSVLNIYGGILIQRLRTPNLGDLDLVIGNIRILDQNASLNIGSLQLGSTQRSGVLMNNKLALRTVSLQNLNFQRIEARVNSLRAIGILYDCVVLGALRGLLSSVNNTADGVQGVGWSYVKI